MMKKIFIALTVITVLGLSCSKDSTENPVNTESQEPGAIVLSASNETIGPGGQGTIIYATLLDIAGDTMSIGHVIEFEITQAPDTAGSHHTSFIYIPYDDSRVWITNSSTDSNGVAQVRLYSGTIAGNITIKATLVENDSIFTEQTLVTITPNEADHIALTAADPEIEVGYNSTIISVSLVDNFENPVEGEFDFILEVTAAPAMQGRQSVSFNYPPDDYSLLHTVEITTNENGIAETELYSGIKSGWVRIAANLADSSGMTTEVNLITILAGPPAHIDLGPSNNPHIENDSIYCPLSCLIWDVYTNPCRDTSIVINFAVIPDSVANIISPVHADSTGMIITYICYTCDLSFDTIRIAAWSGGLADTTQELIIPPYGAIIGLQAHPDTIYISPGETEISEIQATLGDDLGCFIENGILIFSVTGCGSIYGQSIDTTDYLGYAGVNFRIRYDDIPTDSTGCRAMVRSTLMGYPESANSCEISCIKVQ